MLIFISMKKNWGKEKRSKSSCVDWDMLGFPLTLWTNYLGLIGFLPSLRSDGIICHYSFLTTVFINKPTISMSFQKHDWTFHEGKPLLGATHFPEVGVILPFLCKRYLPRGVERSHTLHIEWMTAGGLSPWLLPRSLSPPPQHNDGFFPNLLDPQMSKQGLNWHFLLLGLGKFTHELAKWAQWFAGTFTEWVCGYY